MRSYKRYTRRKRLLKQIAVVALVFILGFVLLRAVSYMAIQGEIPMINSFNLFRREADTSFGWNLILVNDDYCVPRNYEVELTELSNGEKVDSRIYPQLQQMFDDARAEGLAKGVTCGYVQLGGCIVSKKVAEYFEENVLQCGLTYSGHTLACAAGVAAMKYYKEHDIEGHVAEMHEIVAPFMDEMVKKHKCIGEARCIGLFGALEVVKNKETREPMQEYGVPGPVMPWIFAELKKRGFATFGRENFIEICPPLIITKEELEEYLPILDEVLTMVDEKFCD